MSAMLPRQNFRPFAIAAMAGVFTLAARADDFSAYFHDNQHTGRSTSNLDPASLVKTWSVTGYDNPIIVGDTVYAAHRNGESLASISLSTGAINWSSNIAGGLLAVGGGYLVATGDDVVGSNAVPFMQVYNAATGAPLYSMNVGIRAFSAVVIETDTTTSLPVAYLANGTGNIAAVRLGPSSGTLLWSASGISNAPGIPAILGDYLILTGGRKYAINRTTGAVTQFGTPDATTGGTYNPVVDAAHNRLYFNNAGTLRAYGVSGNTFTDLWQATGTANGIGTAGESIALDANGFLYSNSNSTLAKIDPATGNVVASVAGNFSTFATPIVTSNSIYAFGPNANGFNQSVLAYDLNTLSFIAKYPADFASATAYNGKSAISDNYLIFDDSAGAGKLTAFQGTSVPEPAASALLLLGGTALLRRRA
jgi:hypothetical protein